MKKISLTALLTVSALFIGATAYSQSTDNANTAAVEKESNEKVGLPKPYNPTENADAKIAELVKQAQGENKNIIMQAGGNWCIWCLRFNNFVETTPELKQLVDDNYLYYHLNYSPENKNEKVFARYGNPGAKFGYPVLIVLDKNGKMIHVQETGGLEAGNGYDLAKVKAFFEQWKPEA
ncbi:MAG: thioredoxin family protein [Chryseobacterium sp.]|nr:MAG: thioredoxin family protein [Chryseobacterium sp.]